MLKLRTLLHPDTVVVKLSSTQFGSRDPSVRLLRIYTMNGYILYQNINIVYRYIFTFTCDYLQYMLYTSMKLAAS